MTIQTLTTGTVIEQTDARKEQAPRRTPLNRPRPLKQMKRFVEETDWDDRILAQEHRFDVASIGLLLLAAILLAPLFVQFFRG